VSNEHDATGLERFELSIDRDAEVPIGVQLAWALRARIHDGTFKPGQRLPALRDLADATGVNVNTARAVYQRLDQEGLIDSQHGSGTFVGRARSRRSDVGMIAAGAAREAQELGIDPREVAAALYASPEPSTAPADKAAERRRLLRMQISALERALGQIEAEHPGVAPVPTETYPAPGPTLLDAERLEQVRAHLVRRLAVVQEAIDQAKADDEGNPPSTKRERAERKVAAKAKRGPRAGATPRAAPAGG
jgi:DNA-binding transcriptional regulator YhcF (GntR family)